MDRNVLSKTVLVVHHEHRFGRGSISTVVRLSMDASSLFGLRLNGGWNQLAHRLPGPARTKLHIE